MIGEIWKIVPSSPQFLVSSEGRIMVTPYIAAMPNGGGRQYGGYPHFGVWNKQDARFTIIHKGKTYKMARLICEAFNGAPLNGQVCMHVDENAANNRPDNLIWGTQKENLSAPTFLKYQKLRLSGALNPQQTAREEMSLERDET